jgi:putative oxidoreductase
VADPSEAPTNRWSPSFLSILRIIAAFVYGVHGTQKLFGFPAPFPVPHIPPLFLAGGIFETFGGLLLLPGLFT